MNNDENTTRTLTQIAAILQIAHRDALAEARAELIKDKANQAIFKATASWAETAAIEKAVVGSKAASRSTLYVRLADLADRAEVFLLVDGRRTQQDIVAGLKQKGIGASQPTVSRKLTKLNVELGLVEIGDRDAAGAVYAKSDLDRILHLTPKVERRLNDLRKASKKPQK